MLNLMAMHVQCHTNVGKQKKTITFLDGIDDGPSKQPVCGRDFN